MTDTPKQAQFRALVRAELNRCEYRADERVGPGRLGALGWGNGRNLNGPLVRIRREEMERAGFRRGPRGFWLRVCQFLVAADPASRAPRGDLVPCNRFHWEHPVVGIGRFVDHKYPASYPVTHGTWP